MREKSPVDVKNAFLRVPAMGIMCHVGNINRMNEGRSFLASLCPVVIPATVDRPYTYGEDFLDQYDCSQ